MGSSPLTRGKLHGRALHVESDGLIPAHAGKTTGLLRRGFCVRAHPRSRGENVLEAQGEGHRQGSSPLTRGKPTRPVSRSMPTTAHPRSRGENGSDCRSMISGHGSSPLTRGKHTFTEQRPRWKGLIPAHAGKTARRAVRPVLVRAHPRSRGENRVTTSERVNGWGSSPLTRGKPPGADGADLRFRLIPAHAGKTTRRGWRGSALSAHPRSRGENSSMLPRRSPNSGSSPLTRGKRPARGLPSQTRGLIPAHAGKTEQGTGNREAHPAHPRSRGEN